MCVSLLILTAVVSLAAGLPQGGGQAPTRAQSQAHAAAQSDFACGIEDGIYEDYEQCDLYWECVDGVATPHLCDDGLVFDLFKAKAGHVDPCDTPLVVDCIDRPIMQEPTYPNHYCNRRHGVFADPDTTICNRFHTCKDGHKESSIDCTPGLHYSIEEGICTWPESAGRVGCVERDTGCIKNGNFCCPGEPSFSADGMLVPHPTFIDFDDCQKFYVCLNGKTPQESSCTLGQVFNDKTSLCDYPENVPECKDFYANHPLFDVLYDDAQ